MLRKQSEKAEKYYNSTATDRWNWPKREYKILFPSGYTVRRGEIVIIFVLCTKSTWNRGRRDQRRKESSRITSQQPHKETARRFALVWIL